MPPLGPTYTYKGTEYYWNVDRSWRCLFKFVGSDKLQASRRAVRFIANNPELELIYSHEGEIYDGLHAHQVQEVCFYWFNGSGCTGGTRSREP